MTNPALQSAPLPPPELHGIDVSDWQAQIDWSRVARARPAGELLSFAYIKATEGRTWRTKHIDRAREANGVGLATGLYHFLRETPVQDQARNFCDTYRAMTTGIADPLAPVCDVEAGHSEIAAVALAWCRIVRDELGVDPVVYTYTNFQGVLAGAPELGSLPLWLADVRGRAMPEVRKPWREWTVWQWTFDGRVDGIVGDVDLNRARALVR